MRRGAVKNGQENRAGRQQRATDRQDKKWSGMSDSN
jgi:hypothetical protein